MMIFYYVVVTICTVPVHSAVHSRHEPNFIFLSVEEAYVFSIRLFSIWLIITYVFVWGHKKLDDIFEFFVQASINQFFFKCLKLKMSIIIFYFTWYQVPQDTCF